MTPGFILVFLLLLVLLDCKRSGFSFLFSFPSPNHRMPSMSRQSGNTYFPASPHTPMY